MRALAFCACLLPVASAHAVEVGVSGPSVWNGDADAAVAEAQRLVQSGAVWSRLNFRLDIWTAPDDATPRGPQNLTWFEAYDRLVDYLTTHGVQIYAEIGGESVPGGGDPNNDDFVNRWSDAFVKIVDHFKNRVRVYETFNEPNNWRAGTMTPAVDPYWLAKAHQTLYLATKWNGRQNDRCNDVTIVLGAILACCGGNGADYLAQYYQAGHSQLAFDWMHEHVGTYPADGFGIHPYDSPQAMPSVIGGFWNEIAAEEGAGTSKQMWASEFGWTTNDTPAAQIATNLTDSYDALATVPHMAAGLWFTFGAYAGYGLLDGNGNPTPAYGAFVNAAARYRSSEWAMFVQDDVPAQMTIGETRTVTLVLKNLGLQTWTRAGNFRLTSASGCPSAAVTNQIPMATTDGYVNNPLTDVRVFLPASANIATNDTAMFAFQIAAPTQPGTYTLGTRMVQENVAFFGDTFRKSIEVVVVPPTPDAGAPDASASSDAAPPGGGFAPAEAGCGCDVGRGAVRREPALVLLGAVAFIIARVFRRTRSMASLLGDWASRAARLHCSISGGSDGAQKCGDSNSGRGQRHHRTGPFHQDRGGPRGDHGRDRAECALRARVQ